MSVTITGISPDKTVADGRDVYFMVEAIGDNLSYRWQRYANNAWQDTGATLDVYAFTATLSLSGSQYRCIVSDNDDSATSSTVTLTVTAAVPLIKTSPANKSVVSLDSVTFSVVTSGTVTGYQWEVSTDNGSTWSNYTGAGANTASITFTAQYSQNGNKYRCKASNTVGTATSGAATLTVAQASSWTTGTDEEVAALLDAAAAGTTDLQQDEGWAVGDIRTIQISSFTGGFSIVNGMTVAVQHAAQYIRLAISSFDEYRGCGNVIQFDFADTLAEYEWMSNSESSVSFGATSMKTVVLPALVDALPAWIKNRLKTFSVLVGTLAGTNAGTIETVTGNKLALRSEIEVTGSADHSISGEGSQIPFYLNSSNLNKPKGNGSTQNSSWWLRSPFYEAGAPSDYFCIGNGGSSDQKSAHGVAPFGCLGGLTIVAPTITVQPSDQSVTEWQTATFAVTASGGGLSYQWQVSTDNGSTWNNYTGTDAANASISFTAATSQSGNKYRCTVTNTDGSVTSNAATLTVTSAVAPAITTHPSSVSVSEGQSATFAVAASGTSPSYQWQQSSDGTTWTDISGATGTSYTIASTTTAMSGKKFRCVATNTAGSATSNAATLTVTPVITLPVITSQPQNQTVSAGDSATFSVTATGSSLSYQWQSYRNSTWYTISGATAASYTIAGTAEMSGTQYHCIVSNTAGAVTSNTATLTVTSAPSVTPPTITTHPTSQSVNDGDTVTFTVAASGTNLSYQWQVIQDGTTHTWVSISGATGTTYSISATSALNGKKYRCAVTNEAGTVYSNAATLTVTAQPSPTPTPTPTPSRITNAMRIIINGVDITRFIRFQGLKWSRNDVDGPNAGRNMIGDMIRDRVATKIRIDISCRPLTSDEHQMLMNLIMPEFVTVMYNDPVYGFTSKTMYANNNNSEYCICKSDGREYWHNVTFPLIEK